MYWETVFSYNETRPWKALRDPFTLRMGIRKLATYLEMNFYQEKKGFHFLVHSPYEFPNDAAFEFFVDFQYFHVKLEPQMMLIGEDLKAVSSERRDCYFDHEKPLNFFKVYTKYNCEHECQSQIFAEKCGCVPFDLISECRFMSYVVIELHRDILQEANMTECVSCTT